MKKRTVDLLFIIALAITLITLSELKINVFNRFAIIPILAVYYFGQFVQRRFKK